LLRKSKGTDCHEVRETSTAGEGAILMMLQRPGMGVVTGGTDVNAPIVSTHWWCPIPGTPVSFLDSMLGCPKDAAGLAPQGAQPSDVVTNPLVYQGQIYAPVATAPPPHNPAVGAGTSTISAPYDCEANPLSGPNCPGYDAALAASTAAQKAAQDAQNQANMQQVADNIRAAAQAGCPVPIVDNGDGTYSCPYAQNTWTTIALLAGGTVLALWYLGRR
jgi:hypothetical protein